MIIVIISNTHSDTCQIILITNQSTKISFIQNIILVSKTKIQWQKKLVFNFYQ